MKSLEVVCAVSMRPFLACQLRNSKKLPERDYAPAVGRVFAMSVFRGNALTRRHLLRV
jgi:hypothetical protein